MRRKMTVLLVSTAVVTLFLQLASLPVAAQGPPLPFRRPELSGVVRFPPQMPQQVREPSPPPAAVLGPDVDVSSSGAPQNETTAAVDPANSLHVIAGANDYRLGDASCGFYNTTNGGTSWTALMLPRIGFDAAGDPAVRMASGTIASACLHFNRGGGQANAIILHTSTDGGMTFAQTTVASSPNSAVFHDKPYLAMGPNGAVYVSWTRFDATGSRIVFVSKLAGATSFSTPVEVGDTLSNQGSVPVVSGGFVHVAWLRYPTVAGDPFEIRLDRAAIDGVTGAVTGSFGTDTVVRQIAPIPSPFTGQSFRVNSFPTLAAGGANLYLAWAQRGAGADEGDIVFSRSTNGGTTWSTPIRVNDDNTSRDQFFPWMAVDGSGNVHVIWYDKRDDSKDKKFHTYYARSANGGLSFLANQRLSDRASSPSGTDQFGGQFIGDYNGIAADGSTAYPVFMAYSATGPRGRFSDQEVYSERVP